MRAKPTQILLGLLLALTGATAVGCASATRYVVRARPAAPYDVVVVPGCPSNPDGTLSSCQLSRALAAAALWEDGQAAGFITSGGAVHNQYVEAEALAAAMTAAGVPAERIWLEPDALHTDENMYYSLRIARALGRHTIAVVSTLGHAAWGCRLIEGWGQSCGAYGVDLDAVKERHRRLGHALDGVRTPPANDWLPLEERERRLAARGGLRRRPSSLMLYPMVAIMGTNGEAWTPPYVPPTPRVTWAERARAIAATATRAALTPTR